MRCDVLQRVFHGTATAVPGRAQVLCSNLGQKACSRSSALRRGDGAMGGPLPDLKGQVKFKEDEIATAIRRLLTVNWSKLAVQNLAERAGSLPKTSEHGIPTIACQSAFPACCTKSCRMSWIAADSKRAQHIRARLPASSFRPAVQNLVDYAEPHPTIECALADVSATCCSQLSMRWPHITCYSLTCGPAKGGPTA